MDEVHEDNQEFQGLLEAEEQEAAAYTDISAKLLGVELASEQDNYGAITEEPEADVHNLAAAALDNAGINTVAQLCTARDLADAAGVAPHNSTETVVEAYKDKIVYKITFDLPNAGLEPEIILNNVQNVQLIPPADTNNFNTMEDKPRQSIAHCTRSRAPRMSYLQLGEVQTHRSVLGARQYVGKTKKERIHASTSSSMQLESKVNEGVHRIDPELVTESKDEMKVWANMMTQYNLKPGLRKFGARGSTAAIDKLTQLHVMDTWMAMDPSKLTREDWMKVLELDKVGLDC
jgi:hypothetical protein